MQSLWNEEKRIIPPILLLTVTLGFLAAYNHEALIVCLGVLIFGAFVCLAVNEAWIKAVLPPYLLLILLQDTLKGNLDLYIPSLGTLVNYMDEAFLAVCLTALAINFLNGKKIRGVIVLAAVCLMLVFGTVSSYMNSVPLFISLQGAFLMTKGVLYLFVFMNLPFTERDFKRLIKWVKVVAIAVIFFAVVDMVLGGFYRGLLNITYTDGEQRGIVPSVVSLFPHPGLYGWFMAFIGLFGLAAFAVTKDKRFLWAAVLFFFFAFLSFRFKVMLTVLVVLAALYLLGGVKKALTFLLPIVLVGIIVFSVSGQYIINLTVSTIESYVTAEIGDSARKALYVTSYDIGKENFPFGEGFGRFGGFVSMEYYSPVYREYGIDTTYGLSLSPEEPNFIMDTYWPNIAGELGFVGAAVVLGLYLYITAKLLRYYSKAATETQKICILFAGLIMIQGLVESLGEPIFNSSPQNVFIFITLGIAFSFLKNGPMDTNSTIGILREKERNRGTNIGGKFS